MWPARGELVLVRGDTVSRLPSDAGRRSLNVAVAAIALILLAPVMSLIALAIKLTSPGPIIFSQARVGLDRRRPGTLDGRRKMDYGGRLFTMYKFRTMRETDASHQVWARPNDDRVTPIGHILRKYRLDELPQLWNVLKGDMNVVGPRPEQPTIFAQLRDKVQHYPIRQRMLPGITGWAQVNQPYDRCIDDVRNKVRYDLQYLEKSSVTEDLKILALTVPVMVMKKGAW
ncbi:MAG TPA: sugar transferase [Gemmatimonadaceae bacterium]|nr:sugar transferase [Gemmatimonadaceae bacterium]